MAKSNYPHKQRNGGSNRGALIALLVLLIIAAAVFLLRSCTDGKTPNPAPGGIVYDPGAVEGGWNEADTDKIVDALNEKVEQGMINISMNTTPRVPQTWPRISSGVIPASSIFVTAPARWMPASTASTTSSGAPGSSCTR